MIENDPRLRELEAMHDRRTVSRESIIAWYRWYSQFPSNHLPVIHPERSDVDLIRTVALWMELTDRGGSPAFPFEYKSDIQFSTINVAEPAPANVAFLLGALSIVAGLLTLFFNWRIGLALMLAGCIIQIVGYKRAGGATNPNLMKQGSHLYEKEGKRVLEWAAQQSDASSQNAQQDVAVDAD